MTCLARNAVSAHAQGGCWMCLQRPARGGGRDDGDCTQGSSSDQTATADIKDVTQSPGYYRRSFLYHNANVGHCNTTTECRAKCILRSVTPKVDYGVVTVSGNPTMSGGGGRKAQKPLASFECVQGKVQTLLSAYKEKYRPLVLL
jgi:hypothetical protein